MEFIISLLVMYYYLFMVSTEFIYLWYHGRLNRVFISHHIVEDVLVYSVPVFCFITPFFLFSLFLALLLVFVSFICFVGMVQEWWL